MTNLKLGTTFIKKRSGLYRVDIGEYYKAVFRRKGGDQERVIFKLKSIDHGNSTVSYLFPKADVVYDLKLEGMYSSHAYYYNGAAVKFSDIEFIVPADPEDIRKYKIALWERESKKADKVSAEDEALINAAEESHYFDLHCQGLKMF